MQLQGLRLGIEPAILILIYTRRTKCIMGIKLDEASRNIVIYIYICVSIVYE